MIEITDLFRTSNGQQIRWTLNFLIKKSELTSSDEYKGLIITNSNIDVVYYDINKPFDKESINKIIEIFKPLKDNKRALQKIKYIDIEFENYEISFHIESGRFNIITIFDSETNSDLKRFRVKKLVKLIDKEIF